MSGKNLAMDTAVNRAIQRIKNKCGGKLTKEEYLLIRQEVQEAIRMVLRNM